MKTEFTLTAFKDHNGSLGWGIGSLDNTFEELDACVDGRLLAHDLLEHNHASTLQGVENELEALGAAEYVRGALEFDSDLLFMASYVMYDGIQKPSGNIEEINGYMLEACKNFDCELGLSAYDTEERKNLKEYIKYASTYMQNGHDWASDYYSKVNVGAMFNAIQESFLECDYEGQQMVIMLDFDNLDATWHDLLDIYEDEEY